MGKIVVEGGKMTLPALSEAARGFLRTVRIGGKQIDLTSARPHIVELAKECQGCGYLHIADDGFGKLTGAGQAYLDRLMRAN